MENQPCFKCGAAAGGGSVCGAMILNACQGCVHQVFSRPSLIPWSRLPAPSARAREDLEREAGKARPIGPRERAGIFFRKRRAR